MEYKAIIKALKESSDPNVQAFVKDVEKIKKLTQKEKKEMFARVGEPGVVDILVRDYIPTIIRVAHANSMEIKTLSVLDLVNEGVVAAYRFFETHSKLTWLKSDQQIRHSIINAIKSVLCKEACPFAVCRFDENDPELYKTIDAMWASYSKKTSPSEPSLPKINTVKNDYGVKVRQCCASCAHKDLTRAVSKRYCTVYEQYVKPKHVCNCWEMSEQMKAAGKI